MNNLSNKIPLTEGNIFKNHNLAIYTWFKVGGPAEILFIPDSKEDLISFVKKCPKDVPITILGAGSNVLIRDGGINGITIKLGKEFKKIDYIKEKS